MKSKLDCVLLIDDNEDDNYFHKLILEETPLVKKVSIAESSFEALGYLGSGDKCPDLIFLDINMPKVNGWEFIEEYKKLKSSFVAQPVIIILTTSLNPADREKAEGIPEIHGFETKPLTWEKIERIISRFFPEGRG